MVDSANLLRLVHFFDILAAVVFAVSGALVASRKGMDVTGFMWLAVITGVGFLVTFTVRGLAMTLGWSLPVFRESTKREPWNNDRKNPARQ